MSATAHPIMNVSTPEAAAHNKAWIEVTIASGTPTKLPAGTMHVAPIISTVKKVL